MKKSFILIFVLFMGCSQLYDWQTKYPDNLAEEYIEDFVESKTGKKIDLTPITGDERQELNK